jgi:peptide deformylase
VTLLKVLTVPNPRLHLKAEPVPCVDAEVRQLMDDLLETMHHHDGVGLAATQVDVQKRVLVMDFGPQHHPHPYKIANPEILETSPDLQEFEEGCLSVPNQYGKVKRPSWLVLRYLDENNQQKEERFEGFLAECIHHENDHLNGKLFIDYFSPLKKSMMIKRVQKELIQF